MLKVPLKKRSHAYACIICIQVSRVWSSLLNWLFPESRFPPKLTHQYNTRATYKRRMELAENENRELRERVDRLTTMVETLLSNQATQVAQLQAAQTQVAQAQAAQAQAQAEAAQAQTQIQAQVRPTTAPAMITVISEVHTTPVTAVTAPVTHPWGMPENFIPEGYQPAVEVTPKNLSIFTNVSPVIHSAPHVEEQVYHGTDPGLNDRMDDFQDQFAELQKEMRALRGKELFGRDVNEMCLVPNVKVPAKFKLPEFKKYKGSSCPQTHLVMYVRKMSMYTDDQRMLIHYFQDSLTGVAL